MGDLIIVSGCLIVVLGLLWIERLVMNRIRSAIPTRIVVIGTRGKTSVTRLIAAGLREGGIRVLAKTTGSEPRMILPSGDEQPIRRWGLTTPLEQRRILYRALKHKCSAVVVEAMSIRPESLRAELGQITCPHVVVITNTYEDHLADMGDPAAVFADAVPAGSTVFLPGDFPDEQRDWLAQRDVPISVIEANEGQSYLSSLPYAEWPQNLALALAACEERGVSVETALPGMARARMDVGRLGAWTLRDETSAARWMAVNAFATNDPQSAMATLERSLRRWPMDNPPIVGLLNLRRDRGDRTLQWMEALDHHADVFDRMIVCGAVPIVVQRRLNRHYGDRMAVVRSADPGRIMAEAMRLSPMGGVVFGFGNIGDVGIRIVEYWQDRGEAA